MHPPLSPSSPCLHFSGQPLTPSEVGSFKDYFYHIVAARGSGEFALRHILAPGAWAHAPLQQRLLQLKVRSQPITFKDAGLGLRSDLGVCDVNNRSSSLHDRN